MDIDLLSKMIKELILDNDEVTLPGVGTFVAEVMPSVFSDKGYTINPPYRKLSFRQRETSDISLIDFYARSNGLDTRTASSIILKFLEEMTAILKSKKAVILPGLGRLRATKENNFFFIADEDLNIYPEGFGLEPLSLKTHVETDDDVVAAVAGLQSILESQDVIAGPVSEAVPDAPAVEHDPVEAAEAPDDSAPVLGAGEAFMEPAIEEVSAEAPAKPDATASAAAGTEAENETAAGTEAETAAVADVEAEIGIAAATATEAVAIAAIEAVTEADTETGTDAATVTEAETAAEPRAESMSKPEPETAEAAVTAETAAEPKAEPRTELESETAEAPVAPVAAATATVTATEAATEPEAGTEAANGPASEPARPSRPADRPRVYEPWSEFMEHYTPVAVVPPKPRGPRIAILVIVIILVLLGLFILLAHVAPDFTDKLLYSPEELEILRQI